jgi:hypothetical protein
MAWIIGGKPNPNHPVPLDASLGKELRQMEEIERCTPEQIKLFQNILEEEFAIE